MNPSRILIVGSQAPVALENMYFRAFQNLKMNCVDFFDSDIAVGAHFCRRFVYPWKSAELSKKLQYFLKDKRSFYDWIIVFKGMPFTLQNLERGRELAGNSLWININPDDPFNVESRGASNGNVLNSILFYDIYAIWSLSIRDRLEKMGCRKAVYLPFGCDDEMHGKFILSKEIPTPGKVLFMGTWDRQREKILNCLRDCDVDIYGDGWQNIRGWSSLRGKIKGGLICGVSAREKVAQATICLNLLRPQNKGSHNMKTFEIPAMGGFMLSTRTLEQTSFFREGLEADYFSDENELLKKVHYYIEHPEQAAQIAQAGHQRCIDLHATYTQHLQNFINLLKG